MFKRILNNYRVELNKERKGFAITFEIMFVMFFVSMAVSAIIYVVELTNTQRFFMDVMASTCTAVSRYGGDNSRAYQFQLKENGGEARGTITDNANKFLTAVNNSSRARGDVNKQDVILEPGADGKFLRASEKPEGNGTVWVTLSYGIGHHGWGNLIQMMHLFDDGSDPAHIKTHRVELPTLMQQGILLE